MRIFLVLTGLIYSFKRHFSDPVPIKALIDCIVYLHPQYVSGEHHCLLEDNNERSIYEIIRQIHALQNVETLTKLLYNDHNDQLL